jgi:thiol-disulfide isomerase/thioredoxin
MGMVFRGCLLALVLLSVEPSLGAQKLWSLQGRVVDQEGHSVAGASVTTNWGANGVTLEQLHRFEKDGKDHPELTTNEGRLEPWGLSPAQTDVNGNFSIQLHSTNDYKMLAVDKERKRGALIIVDPRNPPARVECRLVPLIRVHGRFRVAATGQPVHESSVFVSLPMNEEIPLGHDRLIMCNSTKSRFEFWLPPGEYQFEASAGPPRLELTEPHPIRLTSGQREFDCGVFDLVPVSHLWIEFDEAKKSGRWRDLKQRYGQPCPPWHVVDARGVPKGAKPSDFRGKWVLVYFWGFGCGPCVETKLPKLREFYEAHKSERDRFELVSICSDLDAKMQTMADLDRKLKPVLRAVWHGKDLPFPVLLDNTSRSMENFGVELFGISLLIDPSGRLVQGDESTLAAMLKKRRENRSSGRP